MYMTSTLPLFTGDSVLTTPSTQETVKQTLSDYDQSGMSGFHVYVSTTIILGTLCMYTIMLIIRRMSIINLCTNKFMCLFMYCKYMCRQEFIK